LTAPDQGPAAFTTTGASIRVPSPRLTPLIRPFWRQIAVTTWPNISRAPGRLYRGG
jgi:hypothetical protein